MKLVTFMILVPMSLIQSACSIDSYVFVTEPNLTLHVIVENNSLIQFEHYTSP